MEDSMRFDYIVTQVLKFGEDQLWLSGTDLKNVKIFASGNTSGLSVRILDQIVSRIYARTDSNSSEAEFKEQIVLAFASFMPKTE